MSRSIKYLLSASLSFFVLCLDQASKILVRAEIQEASPKIVIEGLFNIVYVQNTGGAFGLFAESAPWLRFILFLLFPLVCVYLIFSLLKEAKSRWEVLALSLILGGALGNYMDRVRLGYVVDFVDWHFRGWHWPAFNIADASILTGVFATAFFYLKFHHPPQQSKNGKESNRASSRRSDRESNRASDRRSDRRSDRASNRVSNSEKNSSPPSSAE